MNGTPPHGRSGLGPYGPRGSGGSGWLRPRLGSGLSGGGGGLGSMGGGSGLVDGDDSLVAGMAGSWYAEAPIVLVDWTGASRELRMAGQVGWISASCGLGDSELKGKPPLDESLVFSPGRCGWGVVGAPGPSGRLEAVDLTIAHTSALSRDRDTGDSGDGHDSWDECYVEIEGTEGLHGPYAASNMLEWYMAEDPDMLVLAGPGSGEWLSLRKLEARFRVRQWLTVTRDALGLTAGQVAPADALLSPWRWEFCMFRVVRSPETAVALAAALLVSMRLPRFLPISEDGVHAFLTAVAASTPSGPDGPRYHNLYHAADVCQVMTVMLTRWGGLRLLTAEEALALWIASIARAVEHPGVTNDMLVASEHECSLRFGDEAPLEKHQAARCAEMMREAGLLDRWSREGRNRVRNLVHSLLLSTDMRLHSASMRDLEAVGPVIRTVIDVQRSGYIPPAIRSAHAIEATGITASRALGSSQGTVPAVAADGGAPPSSAPATPLSTPAALVSRFAGIHAILPLAPHPSASSRGDLPVVLWESLAAAESAVDSVLPNHSWAASRRSLVPPGPVGGIILTDLQSAAARASSATPLTPPPGSLLTVEAAEGTSRAEALLRGPMWEYSVVTPPSSRSLLACLLLHAADLSKPTRTWSTARLWSQRLVEEMCTQGDRERALALPISPGMDRSKMDEARFQLGFIDFVVAPLFAGLTALLPRAGEAFELLTSNRRRWHASATAALAAKETETEAAGDSLAAEHARVSRRNIQRRSLAYRQVLVPVVRQAAAEGSQLDLLRRNGAESPTFGPSRVRKDTAGMTTRPRITAPSSPPVLPARADESSDDDDSAVVDSGEDSEADGDAARRGRSRSGSDAASSDSNEPGDSPPEGSLARDRSLRALGLFGRATASATEDDDDNDAAVEDDPDSSDDEEDRQDKQSAGRPRANVGASASFDRADSSGSWPGEERG